MLMNNLPQTPIFHLYMIYIPSNPPKINQSLYQGYKSEVSSQHLDNMATHTLQQPDNNFINNNQSSFYQ